VTALLDTNVVIWLLLDDPRLDDRLAGMLDDSSNRLLLSPINAWEFGIKIGMNKFQLHAPFDVLWRRVERRYDTLPITPQHVSTMISLPWHHKDPFDRMLVAQALTEHIPLISVDAHLDAYGVQRIG
jgi:PIN domain nuclease of toxin-antitoxin system